MTLQQILKFNEKTKKLINLQPITDPPTAAPKDFKGWPFRLWTDGRKTKIEKPFIISKFSCPFCDQFTLWNDSDNVDDIQHFCAECTNCSCVIFATKPYNQCVNGQLIRMHW